LHGDLAYAQSEALAADALAQAHFPNLKAEGGAFAIIFVTLVDAEVAWASGDYGRALSRANDLIASLRGFGIRPFMADALYLKGKALESQGRLDEASRAFKEALAEAEAVKSRRALWPILLALSDIDTRGGRLAESERLRRQARAVVEGIATRIPSAETRASFLASHPVRAVLAQA
jgi:tetratricopeptide (TPR) repeat protein